MFPIDANKRERNLNVSTFLPALDPRCIMPLRLRIDSRRAMVLEEADSSLVEVRLLLDRKDGEDVPGFAF